MAKSSGPAYDLNPDRPVPLARPIVIGGSGTKDNVYRAPAGMMQPCPAGTPPDCLGQFWPK